MRSDRWMLAAMALCLPGLTQAAEVENVSASSIGGRTEVLIDGTDLPRPRIATYLGGRVMAVEFAASLKGKARKLDVQADGLRSVRVRWRSAKPAVVRVDLRLTRAMPAPSVAATGRGWRVAFGPVAASRPVARPTVAIPRVIAALVTPRPRPTAAVSIPKNPPLARVLPAAPPLPDPSELRITLDFVNTDVVQILKALAMQAGVNVVTAPEVKGALTVSLHDVTVDAALKIVTSLAGIDFARVEDTYIVATRERLGVVRRQAAGEAEPSPEAPVAEAYLVRGGKAADLIAAVAGKDSTRVGNVGLTATPPTSSSNQAIVLHGPAAEVKSLRSVFEQIDRQGAEGEQFEILDVRYVNPRALREDLIVAVPGLRATVAPASAANPRVYRSGERVNDASTVAGDMRRVGQAQEQAGGGGGNPDTSSQDAKAREDVRDNRNARGLTQPFNEFEPVGDPMRIVLRGTPDQIKLAREYATKVDVAPRQVALELRVMELGRTEALRLGLDWSILGNGTVRLLRLNNGVSGAESSSPGNVTGAFSGNNVLATLDAISTRQNLIARPNLLAIDGRESELFVGDVVRYIKAIQATQNGITVITDEERVGVRLAVFPRVGGDGQISLDVRPVLSYLRGFTAVPGGGQLPQTSERTTQATTVIRSGETIALGGLILDQDRRDVRGIPILKDLPIVGQLFRRTENSKDRTEVVFFLTARAVDEASRGEAARPKE